MARSLGDGVGMVASHLGSAALRVGNVTVMNAAVAADWDTVAAAGVTGGYGIAAAAAPAAGKTPGFGVDVGAGAGLSIAAAGGRSKVDNAGVGTGSCWVYLIITGGGGWIEQDRGASRTSLVVAPSRCIR